MKTCPECNGDGVIDQGTDDEQRCPTCGGSGIVSDDDEDREEVLKTSTSLSTLGGSSNASAGAGRRPSGSQLRPAMRITALSLAQSQTY